MQFDFLFFLMYYEKMGMPKEGRLSLDFFVIGESTPIPVMYMELAACFFILSFEKSGFQQDVISGNL